METTNTNTNSNANASRSLLYGRNLRKVAQLERAGLPHTACALRASLTAGERVDWREYGELIRTTRRRSGRDSRDPFNLPLQMRAPSPSRIIVSQSLRENLFAIARSGNAVAMKLALALDYRHHHKPALFGNFFTFRERAGLISYCPSNRVQETNEDGTWLRKGRVEISPAKWARRVLCDRLNNELSDADLSAFAAAFAAREKAAEVRIEVAETAEEMQAAVDEVNIGACMEGKEACPWYQAQGVKLVKIVNGNDLTIARAFLWPQVKVEGVEGTVQMLERIYARSSEPISRPALEELLKGYAREIGAWWKIRQSNDCDEVTDGSQQSVARYAVGKANPFNHDFCPYLDTFFYVSPDKFFASKSEALYWLGDGETVELFRSTCGSSETLWAYDGELSETDRSDMVQDVDGEWIHQDEALFCEDDQEHYHTDDSRVVHCDSYDDCRLRENCRSVEIGRTTYIVHEDHISDA